MPPPHKRVAECFCCEYWRKRIEELIGELLTEKEQTKLGPLGRAYHGIHEYRNCGCDYE